MPEAALDGGGAQPALRLGRWLTCAWSLAAGYLLLLAPWATRSLWNEAFFADFPRLQGLLLSLPARVAVSLVGLLLVVSSAWDVASLLRGDSAEAQGSDE